MATTYQAPGVYVEEVASGSAPIAGVGTSTAGFVGIVPDSIEIPGGAVTQTTIPANETADGTIKVFNFPLGNVKVGDRETIAVLENEAPVAAAKYSLAKTASNVKVTFKAKPDEGITFAIVISSPLGPAPLNTPQLCTNFSEFKQHFGDFSTDAGQRQLAYAVHGFFNNGGTRCYVVRTDGDAIAKINAALDALDSIDEIAIVAAPGIVSAGRQKTVTDHCEKMGDRFAILDGQQAPTQLTAAAINTAGKSDYGAIYFPWIDVGDKANDGSTVFYPPSGHVAGAYARVDTERGVHKAPANVALRGVFGVAARLGRADQGTLNVAGINVLRDFQGDIKIWGARTMAGEGEWKYVNVRRLFLFIRESIDEGTQWVVFEPNDQGLWAKINRNVAAFLTILWRDGALFGNTPQEAFFVRCDDSTNPPEIRELGQVVTEIGVAPVKPAEFVIFRISQSASQGGS